MADDYGFGNGIGMGFHSAPAPTGTNIIMLSGVPLDGTQKNQLYFENKVDQENYFLHNPAFNPTQITINSSYQRLDSVIRVDQNAESLYNYNYVCFQNAQYGNKWFYAFITGLEYKGEGVTFVSYQIDVFQTWLFDVQFMPSYVKQMHQKEYRTNSLGEKVPYQRNIDEGMNYGNEYDIVKQIQLTAEPNPYIKWVIIVATDALEKNEDEVFGTSANGLPTPLYFYLTVVDTKNPNKVMPKFNKKGGKGQIDVASLSYFTDAIQNSTKLAGKVASITVTDFCPVNIGGTFPQYLNEDLGDGIYGVTIDALGGSSGNENMGLIKVAVSEMYRLFDIDFGNVYSQFPELECGKLMVSPYSVLEITDFKGHTQTIKPEYVHDSHLKIRVTTSLSWTPKIGYSVVNYNVSDDKDVYKLYMSDDSMVLKPQNWSTTIYDVSSGSIPVSSKAVATYLQSHNNTMATAVTNFDATTDTAMSNAMINAAANAGSGAANGAASNVKGGPQGMAVGAAVGAVTSGVQSGIGLYTQQQTINTSRANLIRGQNAKLQDIKNMPSNIKGMGNNTMFETNNAITGVFVVYKRIKEEYLTKLTDYFRMFGYKANRLVNLGDPKAAFHSRRAWNFVETENIQIVGHINSSAMTELKKIFDNGVTLWHTDTATILVGDYTQPNEEL